MALLHTCRRVLQLIEQKSSLHLCRNIQQSAVLAKKSTSGKKSKDNKLLDDREEKDKLLDAAADVAASMQHIGDEVFDDLAAQIGKMDSGPSDSSSQSASQSSTKGLSADQTKKRIDQILHKYKALSKQSVKSSRSPGKVTSAEDKPPIDEKTSQSERSTPAAKENLPVFSQTAFLDKIIANKGNLQSDALKSNKKSRKGRKGSSSESTASNKVSGDLDGPRMATSFKTQERAKARTTKTQPVDLDLDMDDVPLENIQGVARRRPNTNSKATPIAFEVLKKAIVDGKLSGGDLLAGVEPLHIFNPEKWTEANLGDPIPMPDTWKKQFDTQLEESKFFPHNAFEEMIQWTEEEKLWKFPIDNEQGMDEEHNTPFYEHVFLDEYLQPFPKSGPIKTFMEQVVLGLSKNPHLTVEEKRGHIKWFEEYFREKQPFVTSENLLAESSAV